MRLRQPWMDVPCTCAEQRLYGDHKVGCPRAAAFREYMDPALGVERLARALLRESGHGKPGTVGIEAAKELVEWSRRKAERLMAEYARLEGQPVAEEPRPDPEGTP